MNHLQIIFRISPVNFSNRSFKKNLNQRRKTIKKIPRDHTIVYRRTYEDREANPDLGWPVAAQREFILQLL